MKPSDKRSEGILDPRAFEDKVEQYDIYSAWANDHSNGRNRKQTSFRELAWKGGGELPTETKLDQGTHRGYYDTLMNY